MALNIPTRQLLDVGSKLGEGVLWDAERKVVWFVDIKQHRLWHYDPATGSNAMAEAPGQIGWALPADNGLLLCGLQDGLYLFDPATQTFEEYMQVPGEPAHNRLNDACTDPWGRVWFGSMDDAEEEASGRFYVFDQGEIRPAGPAGITITNGPAVSAQGDRIYFTDTTAQKIMVADLSPTGVSEARPFVDTGALFPEAYPDGPIVDADDHVWTGLYLGSRVARFSPDGELVAEIEFDARDVTKMCLGGPDFRTGYVTTATKNLEPEQFAEYPHAGSLLGFDAPVAGFEQARVRLG
ncbi:SMP-30/gluconolactonase/LRE family protein [Alteraurantiacibacter aquimixticola]|uniref:SMP-30/gluconolactonase/LRE family protein n=1 Tax=Alteraurantiacibacter aquimixticola TaxID=2489173 RepID=A0A4T3F1E5_9SPHN|nr:SMP-30/gluconolactonase/LRE family protein [Alteraurantiacibacter aquimixticola]TIX50976.1 SMP-30/gluconolactonase/LRE family protein [Alteraurantiacibacter aquimixticola]